MLNWLLSQWNSARAAVAAGDVRLVEQRLLPAAIGVGALVGAAIGFLTVLPAVLVFVAGGFAIGYATRSYVSHRRRERYLREKMR